MKPLELTTKQWKVILDNVQAYANVVSECCKVKVGCLLLDEDFKPIEYGANITHPRQDCLLNGCFRVRHFGNDDKGHLCLAQHAEINALRKFRTQEPCYAVVTRYPCYNCAKDLVESGIKYVVFGRQQPISKETEELFKASDVAWLWVDSWIAPDKTN